MLTGQPMEMHRLLLIIFMSIMLSFNAQAFGLFAGSIFSNLTVYANNFNFCISLLESCSCTVLQISLVIGSGIMAFHTAFSGVLILQKDVQPWLKWIFDITFLNYANNGITVALLGYDRGKLPCDSIYCPYRNPKDFLKFLDTPVTISFHPLFIIFFIVHICTFVNMTIKLKRLNR